MLPEIKNAYLSGRLMLLLGAGASSGSRDSENLDIPMGDDLAKELAALMGWSYQGEALSTVYSAIDATDSARLHSFLRRRLTNTRPSPELQTLASFPWLRIFTLNIDDCTETALRKARTQNVQISARNSPLEEIDPIFKYVQLVKLNGSADRPEDGFIFSPQEYGEGSNRLPIWYRELGQNHSNYAFVFVGSKLNEPLFQHAMAEMRSIVKRAPLQGYVITPSASEIDKHHLSSLNLVHVPGTLKDFAEWLSREMPQRPTGWDLATARRPELRNINRALTEPQKRALNSVTLVSADILPHSGSDHTLGAIREFYKGYKPRWVDILDGVPADLAFIKDFSKLVEEGYEGRKCIALVGPAGSGKSTALMITALHLSKVSNTPIYFLREAVSELKEVVVALEQINSSRFYLFIDKMEAMHNEVAELLEGPQTRHVCIVASERLNIWNRRVKAAVEPVISKVFKVEKIRKADPGRILEKLEKFGPWTRLQQMRQEQRVAEIYSRADRQLLIGLMEATTGFGFTQIIDNDFKNAGDDQHKKFLTIVGLASIHRSTLSSHIVGAALSNLGIAEDVNILSRETEGIIVTDGKKYSARHPVYVRELFEKIVPTTIIRDCLIAVLEAFSDYEAPVIKHVGKADSVVFKSIINHRFIKEMMRNDEDKVRSIYEAFETKFHIDGLYWLQYGLALRDFNKQTEALEKLKTAREAYTSPQIEHAYAQQLMIIASMSLSWDDAQPLLNEAIEALRALNRVADATDTYPIVTLAEGHISVMLKFFGVEGTQTIAQQYANELLVARKKHVNARLQEAVSNVMSLATTGSWKESYGPGYLEEN
ncbi:SIR2 family protein [Chelativorans salis]|uniref:SIR2 family protein n=1 Tax=Chelativorans salis TaxID=2978478 RepID=A0ABT2LIB2_9HYPH|nr:SIR2 family protein [Chelativorans sp. EGI FJ00035]MCT7374049.1 SIR2 family protein [Chelativorans sp. EGI FJ00035]